jgi:GT2 family glycosyltransferase
VDRGNPINAAAFNSSELVFGACGAAVLYRRRMLDEIGFLDEDFFLYDEDTDLNFRAQLLFDF